MKRIFHFAEDGKAKWQEAADNNRLPRFEWAEILGESLPIFVFRRLRDKKTSEEIENEIWARMLELPLKTRKVHMTGEIERIIKINVGARKAEFERFKSVMRATIQKKRRCACGGFAQHKLNCGANNGGE